MAASSPTAEFLLQVQTAAAGFAQGAAAEAPAADFLLQVQTAAAAFAQDLKARIAFVEAANRKLQEEKEAIRLRFRTAEEENVKVLKKIKAQIIAGNEIIEKVQEFVDEFGWM